MGRPSADVAGRTLTLDEHWFLLSGFDFADRAFDDAEECRRAWEHHRDRLVDEARGRWPGARPWAWWAFDAGRPEHVEPHPRREPGEPAEAYARRLTEWEVEPVRFLAAAGHLKRDEAALLIAAGRAAQERIGTDRQQGSLLERGVWIGPDRTAAAIGAAVEQHYG